MPNNPPQQLINTQICQQNKRLNMLLFETDAIYSEAAKRLGLIDSDYKILYTMCHLGSKCLLADVVRPPAATSKPSIPPCVVWKQRN